MSTCTMQRQAWIPSDQYNPLSFHSTPPACSEELCEPPTCDEVGSCIDRRGFHNKNTIQMFGQKSLAHLHLGRYPNYKQETVTVATQL